MAELPPEPVVRVIEALAESRRTLAVAESLTGGLVLAALTAVPGASAVVRGGAVVYATDTKGTMLDVDLALLRTRGPVDPDVAKAMASGVRSRWSADIGLATTGVAGPDPQAGRPVGEVFIALDGVAGAQVRRLQLAGGRSEIRRQAVVAAVELLAEQLAGGEEG